MTTWIKASPSLAFASGGVWVATGQSRPGCGGRRGVDQAAGGWAEAHGGGPGKRMVALLLRAFRTAGIVLE